MSIQSTRDVPNTVEAPTSAVSWGAILAGALAASTATFVLMLVGSGLGLTMISPWSGEAASLTTFAVSSAIGLVVVQWLSSCLGGYLAGRLRTRWTGLHDDETFFRDTAHGFMAWAVATLLTVMVLGSALSSLAGAGAQAASTVASGAALAATAGATTVAGSGTAGDNASYFVDTLFRPADATRLAAPGAEGDASAASQASRILAASAISGELSPDDKTYLGQLVAARTGVSQADATARIDATLARIEQAKTDAQAAADTARKAGATFSLLAALSMVIGALIASASAALGGRLRDE